MKYIHVKIGYIYFLEDFIHKYISPFFPPTFFSFLPILKCMILYFCYIYQSIVLKNTSGWH